MPPVMYVLHRRWYKALRQAMLAQLTPAQREQMASFQSKSAGWFTAAAGATLLAAGETWQIVQHYGWPVWVFWLLVMVMLAATVLNTAVLMIGDARIRRAGPAPGVRPVCVPPVGCPPAEIPPGRCTPGQPSGLALSSSRHPADSQVRTEMAASTAARGNARLPP